jgi:predicted anti-sigma-YlaC factor YlaD
MHQEIRQRLEDYLSGENLPGASSSQLPAGFEAHLGECAGCAGEVKALAEQAELLRSLRSPRDREPRAGFYARVMERIEAQPASIWSLFLERRFGFRLAVASAALAALLGAYLVVSEPGGPELVSSPAVALTDTQNVQVNDDGALQQRQRDAVLVDLASYRQ